MSNTCTTQKITRTHDLIDQSIDSKEVINLMSQGMKFTFLDVRTEKELTEFGLIPGSIHVEMNKFNINSRSEILSLLKNNHQIIVYCAGGVRSLLVTRKLREWGFSALNLSDGYFGWIKSGGKSTGKLHPSHISTVPDQCG
jgi:rhodanese-related sulfurtransferase